MGERLTGINLKVFWLDGSGTMEIPTVRSFTPGIGYDTAETSAAGDAMRNHKTTLETFEPSMNYIRYTGNEPGVYGTLTNVPGTAIRTRMQSGVRGTLLWAEQGTASGKPKGAMDVYVTKHEADISYDSELEVAVEFRAASGAWVSNPGTATW